MIIINCVTHLGCPTMVTTTNDNNQRYNNGQWNNVTVRRSGKTGTIYVNGVAAGNTNLNFIEYFIRISVIRLRSCAWPVSSDLCTVHWTPFIQSLHSYRQHITYANCNKQYLTNAVIFLFTWTGIFPNHSHSCNWLLTVALLTWSYFSLLQFTCTSELSHCSRYTGWFNTNLSALVVCRQL